MIGKNLNKKILINSSFVFLIFLLDRFSKLYVISESQKNFDPNLFNSKYLNIYLTWNEGVAFGFFSFHDVFIYNILTILVSVIIIIIIFMIFKSDGIKKYSLLMILGGAVGNFYDRIFYKKVPDFIDFHVGDFHWFIFNVADIFITIGVFFMILLELIATNEEKKI
tara:strand:+ start:390 stop:887 length:498 start_codon:yes stop_codon:yes gene_type:complete